MSRFGSAGRMLRVAATMERSQRQHPQAWNFGIKLADECFSERTAYLKQAIRTDADVDWYIRMASEQVVRSVAEGELAFPEPVTEESLKALGISFGKRLTDAFEAELRGYEPLGISGSYQSKSRPIEEGVVAMGDDFLDSEFSPSLAMDDVVGGSATEAMMWATRQIPRSTEILKASGANNTDSMSRLWTLNSVAAQRLLDAHILLGIHTIDELITSDTPPEAQARVQLVSWFRAGLAQTFPRSSAAPSPTALQRGDSARVAVRDALNRSSSAGDAMAMMRLTVVHEFFVDPLVESGKLSYTAVIERECLPMRLERGAVWNPDSGLEGAPSGWEINEEVRASGHMAPLYFPLIPLTPRQTRSLLEGEWFTSETLYVTDPVEAYGRRASEIASL